MLQPRISIITPSLNQGEFIEQTILSVLDQQYPNLEYIIIDGGSTDNTVEIIRKYEKHLVYWVSEGDKGQSHALNKGFAKATGDIHAWINSDDWYEPNSFETVAEVFKSKSVAVLAGNCRMIFEDRPDQPHIDKPGLIDFQRLSRYWSPFFCPPQPSIFFRSEVLAEVGGLDESLNYGMDLDLWLRISKRYKFHYVDELLSNYLIHAASKSGSGNGFEKFMPEWKKIVERHIKDASLINKIRYHRAKKREAL